MSEGLQSNWIKLLKLIRVGRHPQLPSQEALVRQKKRHWTHCINHYKIPHRVTSYQYKPR